VDWSDRTCPLSHLIECVAARGDEHPVGGLRLAALGVFEHPGKSGLGHVDAERV